MSYLDLPRVHLYGTFLASPSTLNNYDSNYAVDPPNPITPGWNPQGLASWTMDITVQTVVGADGGGAPAGDTLAGATLTSVSSPTAKLVDLDPDQQSVSQVWGLTVALTLSDGTVAFTGDVDPCALADLWLRVQGVRAGGTERAGGMFQTVVRPAWGDVSSSPTMQALKAASPEMLSLKWVVDGYNGSSASPGFNVGRMVATLGPQGADEPLHLLAGRRLRVGDLKNPTITLLWDAPFQVDAARKVLVLDLGNSVAMDALLGGNPLVDALTVSVAAGTADAQVLGTVPYTLDTYRATAGIAELPLTADQLALVRKAPVSVTATPPAKFAAWPASLAEASDGAWVGIDTSFVRLNPGEQALVGLWATSWGERAQRTVDLSLVDMGSNNTPAGGLTFPATVQTEASGYAAVALTGGSTAPRDPARTADDIDGQVYFVGGSWLPAAQAAMGNVPLNVLVWDAYAPATDPPTWWGDVQPILYQFARLYPGMRNILDISDYRTMAANAQRLSYAMSLPVAHPGYMPVTRDLSTAKRQAVLDWVAAGCPEGTEPASTEASIDSAPTAGTDASAAAVPHGHLSIKSTATPR